MAGECEKVKILPPLIRQLQGEGKTRKEIAKELRTARCIRKAAAKNCQSYGEKDWF